tara:strand:- start:11 stop:736 length:726 start_codon:yes stop_codon:yes gene_type:complete
MIINFLFDIDGTLTPARDSMDKEFDKMFGQWVHKQQNKSNKVFFVTGSDRQKTKSQVSESLLRLVDGVYQNSGNQLYIRNNLRWEKHWEVPESLIEDLNKILEKSKWYGKAENNIEYRRGETTAMPMMINFSTVGRSANAVQRKEYFEWDKGKGERLDIVDQLSSKYNDVSFSIGGEISIDIYPKGRDKSQVLSDLVGKAIFFGDRCNLGGNDYEIATMSDTHYNVSGWQETKKIISSNYS